MEDWMIYYGIFQASVLLSTYFFITGHKLGGYGKAEDELFAIIGSFIPVLNLLIFVVHISGEIKHTKAGAKQFGKKLYNYLPFLPVLLLLLLFFI